jgi:hypothetical protein
LGNPGYLVGFAALVAAVWVVMYLPWMLKTLVEKRRTRATLSNAE